MTKHPVPDKYLDLWRTMVKAQEDAQRWFDGAVKGQNQREIRVYSKMVADRTSALANLQKMIWGGMLERLAHRPGKPYKMVRTSVTLDPPEMIIYDSEEEYFDALQAATMDAARQGESVTDAHIDGRIPIRPIHPEAD